MLAISNPDDLLREDRIFYTVMLVECLLLLAIIMMTKAFHCYLHYRAARAGVVLPAEGPALNEGNVQDLHNQVVNEIVHSGESCVCARLSDLISVCV